MYWRLKSIPEFRGVSRNDAQRIVSFVVRQRQFDRKAWLSGFLALPPMCIAFIAYHYFSGQFIIRLCVVAVGIYTGFFLSRAVSINTVLRHRIREVMNDPQQLDSALHDESHLADRVDTITTFVFVALFLAAFCFLLWSNVHEHTR